MRTVNLATRANGHSNGHVSFGVPYGEVTAGLPVLDKAAALQETHQLTRRHLGHAAHSGTATVSSTTWTKRSFCGTGWACASIEARYCSMAWRMLCLVFSMVLPFEKHPGTVGL